MSRVQRSRATRPMHSLQTLQGLEPWQINSNRRTLGPRTAGHGSRSFCLQTLCFATQRSAYAYASTETGRRAQDQGAGRRAQDKRACKTGRRASKNAGTEAQDSKQGARHPCSRTAGPDPPPNKSISRVEVLLTKKKFAPPRDQYPAFHAICSRRRFIALVFATFNSSQKGKPSQTR